MEREEGNDHFTEQGGEGNPEENGKTPSLESWDNPHYAKLLGGGFSLCVLVLTLALGYVVKFK